MSRAVRSLLLVLIVSCITCVAGLGRAAISDSDEAFYAEAAREMVASGDWLTPRFNYANRFQKPVLYYWMAAVAYRAGGVSEAMARLPSALSGVGLALVAWYCGRRWFDARTGGLAGLIAATSLGTASLARMSLPDVPLALFISISIVAAIEGALTPARPRPALMVVAGAAAGAAFLTKGPIGIAIPALVTGALVVASRKWSAFAPGPLAVAAGACIAIGAPWYVAMTRAHGSAYLQSFFIGDNLERFTTDRFNEPRSIWFYVPIVLAGLLPWSAFFALWVRAAWETAVRRMRPAAEHLRLLAWAGLPLLLFTASVGKQPRYILPTIVPIAVALAASIRSTLAETPRAGQGFSPASSLFRWCGAVAGAVVAMLGAILLALPPDALGVSAAWLVGGAAAATIAGVMAVVVSLRTPRRAPAAIVAAAAVLLLAAQYGLLSAPWPETVQLVASRVRASLDPGVRWTTYDVFVRNLIFYVGERQAGPFDERGLVAFLRSDAPALAVMKQEDFERIRGASEIPLYTLGEWRYFNVARIRADLLIHRDAARRVRTVVLVSNRPLPTR